MVHDSTYTQAHHHVTQKHGRLKVPKDREDIVVQRSCGTLLLMMNHDRTSLVVVVVDLWLPVTI